MSRSNRVITAHGPTPPYRVKIGIDQDSYCLVFPLAPYTAPSISCSLDVLEINNLVFMDDSTLISSSKEGMEHMFH
ncbi:hypothetical protein RIR_jg21708.t1 [Rhizophagus irregularis DAOM 181602=DAOM 197198]|nr:hypothetical protein RIR_jg21708.t1 [Rhizophagus irregularis DAOM 181602=DAOM 197198]